MGKIVSFINMKGGVGKTTSSVTFAETSAAAFGKRVLLVDLDAQASASYALCGEDAFEKSRTAGKTLAAYFDRIADGRRPEPLADYRTPSAIAAETGATLDVICSEPSLRYSERALIEHYQRLRSRGIFASTPQLGVVEVQTRRVVAEKLGQLRGVYDLIVIDCPPGISIFAEAGVSCSDAVVAPTIPDYLSTLGLEELNKRFLQELKRAGNLGGRVAILPTKVRAGDRTHDKYLKRLGALMSDARIDGRLLGTFIPQDSAIARALEPELLGEAFDRKYEKVRDDLIDVATEIWGLIDDEPVRVRPSEVRSADVRSARGKPEPDTEPDAASEQPAAPKRRPRKRREATDAA